MGQMISPFFKATRYVRRNLQLAMPELSEREIEKLVPRIWNCLGRTFFELPFIANGNISRRVKIVGLEHLERLKAEGKNAIFVSAHFGNWELLPKMAKDNGFPLVLIYRKVNNRLLESLLHKIRSPIYKDMFQKGVSGARGLIRALQNGSSLAVLIDQKMNSGIEVPFFGRPSMTAPAVAELSMKYNVPIVMAKSVRENGANFTVTIFEPFYITNTGHFREDIKNAMTHMNAQIEDWVRHNPEQWFWVHRRWDKKVYEDSQVIPLS